MQSFSIPFCFFFRFVVLTILTAVALIYALFRTGCIPLSSLQKLQNTANETEKIRMKLLLMWNPLYRSVVEFSNQISKNCPTIKCLATNDRGLLSMADAVLFEPEGQPNMPAKTKLGQVWIYSHLEPPPLRFIAAKPNTINWTMSYRRDSDIPFYYGDIRPRKEEKGSSISDVQFQNRTKLVVWLVSHCKTHGKREEYSKKLQQYIPVDVIGRCGSNICPKNNMTCRAHLLNNIYRYYFAAENSNCRDYITEKAFWTTLYSIIPVVRGGGNYSLYFPKDSVIDVRHFSNHSSLARHLFSVANETSVYAEYFRWKKRYNIRTSDRDYGIDSPYCQLCKRLHQQQKFKRVYQNISSWWTGDKETTGDFCSSGL